jgi:hypothetical protein
MTQPLLGYDLDIALGKEDGGRRVCRSSDKNVSYVLWRSLGNGDNGRTQSHWMRVEDKE